MKLYKDGITVIVDNASDADWYKRAGYVEVKEEKPAEESEKSTKKTAKE